MKQLRFFEVPFEDWNLLKEIKEARTKKLLETDLKTTRKTLEDIEEYLFEIEYWLDHNQYFKSRQN